MYYETGINKNSEKLDVHFCHKKKRLSRYFSILLLVVFMNKKQNKCSAKVSHASKHSMSQICVVMKNL